MDIEAQLEARQSRRLHAQHRFLTRIDRRERDADAMIGELCRGGSSVFYVAPVGGTYREGTRASLIDYLIRNRYA